MTIWKMEDLYMNIYKKYAECKELNNHEEKNQDLKKKLCKEVYLLYLSTYLSTDRYREIDFS